MPRSSTILFAEDDRRLRRLYSDALEASGYSVLSAVDGTEALELLHAVRPTVILLDIMMPNLNGIETCKRARKMVGSEVPIIFLTALDQLDTLRECIAAGGDDYIMKSESVATIVERVRYWTRPQPRRKGLAARRDEMLASVAAEVDRTAAAAVLTSETDESVREIAEFLCEARAQASDEFGRTVKEKLYLLGYATGVVEHWAQRRGTLEDRFFDYLSAVLREAGFLADDEVFEMVSEFDEISADTSFGIARAHGRNDPVQRLSKGKDYFPIGLSQFDLLAEA